MAQNLLSSSIQNPSFTARSWVTFYLHRKAKVLRDSKKLALTYLQASSLLPSYIDTSFVIHPLGVYKSQLRSCSITQFYESACMGVCMLSCFSHV